jgi:hypothetical protein
MKNALVNSVTKADSCIHLKRSPNNGGSSRMRNWKGFIYKGGNVCIIIFKEGGGGSFNKNRNLVRSFALRLGVRG